MLNRIIRFSLRNRLAVLGTTLLLVVAGTVAGLFPARKAAKVRPIEALRVE